MGLFSKRPLIVVHDLAPGKAKTEKPEPDRWADTVVLPPKDRSEAYLTVRGGMEWDRRHLAEFEAELDGGR